MYLVSYIPYIKDIDKAVDMMAELMYQMPEMEIDGIIPIEVAARYDEIKEERRDPVEKLARDIDKTSFLRNMIHTNMLIMWEILWNIRTVFVRVLKQKIQDI